MAIVHDGVTMLVPSSVYDLHKPDFEVIVTHPLRLPSDHIQMGPRINATPEHISFDDTIIMQIPAHAATTHVLRSTQQGTWESVAW